MSYRDLTVIINLLVIIYYTLSATLGLWASSWTFLPFMFFIIPYTSFSICNIVYYAQKCGNMRWSLIAFQLLATMGAITWLALAIEIVANT